MKQQNRRLPAASEAEIRAYLVPRLKAGQPPTYATMRVELGGGGFSRLVRVRKQVETELASVSSGVAKSPPAAVFSVDDLIDRLEEVLERQWRTFEASNQEWLRRREEAAKPNRTRSGIEASDPIEAPFERLEATERRVQVAIEQLQALLQKIDQMQWAVPAPRGNLDDVPPAWARHAAAAATSALDGRLQSLEESVRDAVAVSRSAFEAAADVAREIASTAGLELQVAREEAQACVREVRAQRVKQAVASPELLQAVREIQTRVEGTAGQAASVANHRAKAVSQALMAFADLHLVQVEMMETIRFCPAPTMRRLSVRRR